MTDNYCSAGDIERRLGVTITENTRPNSTDLAGFLDDADDFINSEVRVSENMTDTYGRLKQIAIDIVLKMINNLWSFTHPQIFPYIDIELSDEQKRIIHKNHLKMTGDTWDIGG